MSLLKKIPNRLIYIYITSIEYWKYTKSVELILRMFLVRILEILTILGLLNGMGNKYAFIFSKIKKAFLFYTPFGNYLGISPNSWQMLISDYEPKIREIIISNTKKNKDIKEKVFINIGANIGRWGVEISRNFGYKSILFEPARETFKNLKINTILSGIDDSVELYNFGLGDKDSKMFFEYVDGLDGISRFNGDKKKFSNSIYDEIFVKKFDDIKFGFDINKTKLIIIDVEGFENKVIEGMGKFLNAIEGVDIIIEIHENSDSKGEIFRNMQNNGFVAKQIDSYNWHFSK